MRVRRRAAIAAALILGAGFLFAQPPVEPDPHELYEKARERLKEGDLQTAASLVTRLRAKIEQGSDWDPGRVFADELLPPLTARLKRMQAVARKLDAWSDGALAGLKPPAITDELSTVRHYTDWATATIRALRAERDEIIETDLADPQEQMAITHAPSYLRTERLLQTDVLEKMAESAGDDILGLLSGDPRLESVLVRFRQLKRDLMQNVAERDRLEQQAAKARRFDEAVLRALATTVTEENLPDPVPGQPQPASVSDRFAASLDRELEQVKRRRTQTPVERQVRLADLERLRRFNQALVGAGIGPDQGARLRALAEAVETTPVNDGLLLDATTSSWWNVFLLGVLSASAVFSAWLAYMKSRRQAGAGAPRGPREIEPRPGDRLDSRRWAGGPGQDSAQGSAGPGSAGGTDGPDSGVNVA
jgi:hypothetical protein